MMEHLRRLAIGLGLALLSWEHAQSAEAFSDNYKETFFAAAREGRADLLQGMVKHGMPVDIRDDHGYTALILAAYDDQFAAVDTLLKMHADPCAADLKGNTALMGVAYKGGLAMAQQLVGRCDVNARNRQGQTAAMMASLFGHADIVRLLAARGADLRLQDASGNSADSLARQQGNSAMITLLSELETAAPRASKRGP